MCTKDAEDDAEDSAETVPRGFIIVSHLTNESIKISKLKFMNDGMSSQVKCAPFARSN